MLTATTNLYLSISIQLILTLFLIAVLWSLYNRLHRFEFSRWWAWAWTAFSCFLASALVSLYLGTAWTPLKMVFILTLLVSGILQPLLLVFGGLSWSSPHLPSKRLFRWGVYVAVLTAAVCFLAAYFLRANPIASFAVRNVPRTVAQATALFFCFGVFWQHFRKTRSIAAAITGFFCFTYACDQVLYFLSFSEMAANHWGFRYPGLLHRLASLELFDHTWLLHLDLLDTCGICLGMILLLLERHQVTASELEASERRRLGLAVDNVSLQIQIQERERIERELRRSEESLRQSEKKFATAFRASPHAMTITSLRDGHFIDVNASFEHQSGYSREEVIGKSVVDLGLWDDSADFASIMADTLRRKKVVGRQIRLRAKSGRTVYALYSVEVIDIDGEPCALTAGEDITNRIQIEGALRESEAKFRMVADTVTSAIWLLQENRLVYFNKEFERLTGYSSQELLVMDPWQLVHPDFREESRARAQARLRGQVAPSRYQFALLTKSGKKRWVDFSAAVTEFDGKPTIFGSAFDITATKRAEQELKEHAMYTDALISNTPLGIVIKDEHQRVRFCNAAFEKMFQFTQAEIQGSNLDDFIAPHAIEEASLLSSAVQKGGAVHTTARRRRKDGTLLDVELYGVKVVSGDSFVGAFAIYQDITERKRSEEKLIALRNRLTRAQEEERARIARDLHDDAGQRLALLSIDLEQLKQASATLKSSLTQQLESLVKAASEITSDIHNVSRRLHPSQVELLGLSAALTNFCRDFGARNSMDIKFAVRSPQQKPSQEAALALFRVAQEAVRNVQKHSGTRCALVQLDEISGSLRLRISDEGAGFDLESAEYSEGLGLLSMQERLHSLGGDLFIHSRPGGGTCIEACIPLSTVVPV